jgi:hypothetical protein
MTFLDTHLIIKIRDKVKAIDHIGFIWLDRPIYDKKVVIDRIKLDPYECDEILPISWYAVSPKTRLKIYNALCKDEVYIKQKLNKDDAWCNYYINIKPSQKLKKNEPR